MAHLVHVRSAAKEFDRVARPLAWVPAVAVVGSLLVAGCTGFGVGLSIPIPGVGSVGVGVNNSGQMTGGVSIGTGGVSVGVGGTAQLPRGDGAAQPGPAASAPAARQ